MNPENVNCIKCQYFYVTWDKHFPKGCKLFGFKSRNMPSVTVMESTGSKCSNFILKNKTI
ncbi:MAG: uracil-DNA glycosylase [Clostridia bacterium]|nr:uracil-DNA glycosylase [Clostridia bacterium]